MGHTLFFLHKEKQMTMTIPDKCDFCSKEDDLTQAIGLTFGKNLGREHFLCDGCYEEFFATDTSEDKKLLTFEQFQETRKEVRGPYMGDRGEDPSGTPAMVYLNSDKGVYIGESYHISINPSDFNGEPIEDTGKKYYLILMNAEYNSDNLEELEKILFDWLVKEGINYAQ